MPLWMASKNEQVDLKRCLLTATHARVRSDGFRFRRRREDREFEFVSSSIGDANVGAAWVLEGGTTRVLDGTGGDA